MSIRVRFFASLREAVGADSLELPHQANIEALLGLLRERLSETAYRAISAENVRLAVNQEITSVTTALRDGDEVAFLPPITGG